MPEYETGINNVAPKWRRATESTESEIIPTNYETVYHINYGSGPDTLCDVTGGVGSAGMQGVDVFEGGIRETKLYRKYLPPPPSTMVAVIVVHVCEYKFKVLSPGNGCGTHMPRRISGQMSIVRVLMPTTFYL